MGMRVSWIVCVVLVGGVRAGDATPEMRAALGRAGAKLGAPFHALPGGSGSFLASVTAGLGTCERVDVEVRAGEAGTVEVLAYPNLGGGRVDVAKAADKAALLAKLGAPGDGLAPFAWVAAESGTLHARCAVPGDAPDALEKALLAVPAVDRATADLLPALGAKPRLTEEEITAKLREAGTADEAGRNRILAEIASYLPELEAAGAPGTAAYRKHVMNGRGAAFDAFRFRVPAEGGRRRLVWSFTLPPNTGKGWYIAPIAGQAPIFRNFHKASKLEGTDVPADHTVVFQRCGTPLPAGAEYILWFQFKVETPVEMHFALACVPWASTDRDGLVPLSEALGVKAK